MDVTEELESLILKGDLPTEQLYRRLLNTVSVGQGNIESRHLEHKLRFDDSNESWLSLLRHIVGMANTGGGIIILGMDDTGNRVGIPQSLKNALDPANITNKLRRYTAAPGVETRYTEIQQYRKTYGLLLVRGGESLIVFDKDGQFQSTGQPKSKTVFSSGVLYVRQPGSTAPATYTDLQRAERRIVERHTERFLARVDSVARLPSDYEVMASPRGSTDLAFRITETGEGAPVRVAEADDTTAIPIEELAATSAPYGSEQGELVHQVRLWKHSDRGHRVRRTLPIRWYLVRDGLSIDADAAEFCFLSACHDRGYPMYWAALMNRERLKEVVDELLGTNAYPERQILPYVIGLFWWEERKAFFGRYKGLGQQFTNLANRIERMERGTFLRYSRCATRTYGEGGQTQELPWRAGKALDQTLTLFEALLGDELQAGGLPAGKKRYILYQADMLLHAPENFSAVYTAERSQGGPG